MRTIQLFYSPNHTVHNPTYEQYDGNKVPYAESSDRLAVLAAHLRRTGRRLHAPRSYNLDHILQIHTRPYVDYIRTTSRRLAVNETLLPSNFIMDTYTPITQGTYKAACQAVSTALTATDYVLANHSQQAIAYALCRPPGHHAARKHSGGYCYFNNAAIAAQHLAQHGRVAILDIDYHHGNGTQELFYERSDVVYVSIHADPNVQFPYSSGYANEFGGEVGVGYNRNYPLPLHSGDARYMRTLHQAITDITDFNPDFLVISAGFDGHIDDPICQFNLSTQCYEHIGAVISSIGLPIVVVQEGGYNLETLGILAEAFITGLESH